MQPPKDNQTGSLKQAYSSVRSVSSNQATTHRNLEKVVQKHLTSNFLRPYPAYSIEAFGRATEWLKEQDKPLIFDSFCGVGESSRMLGEQYPDHAIIGIDQSAARLNKHTNLFGELPNNVLLLRADCDDIWRLALENGWRCEQHFMLYPNPWPKSAHLQRRIHGSPVFKNLLALSNNIELRSNWLIYIEEFQQALSIAGHQSKLDQYQPTPAITAFERKYQGNAQALWRLRANLGNRSHL